MVFESAGRGQLTLGHRPQPRGSCCWSVSTRLGNESFYSGLLSTSYAILSKYCFQSWLHLPGVDLNGASHRIGLPDDFAGTCYFDCAFSSDDCTSSCSGSLTWRPRWSSFRCGRRPPSICSRLVSCISSSLYQSGGSLVVRISGLLLPPRFVVKKLCLFCWIYRVWFPFNL